MQATLPQELTNESGSLGAMMMASSGKDASYPQVAASTLGSPSRDEPPLVIRLKIGGGCFDRRRAPMRMDTRLVCTYRRK
jgi:hypothetical protein